MPGDQPLIPNSGSDQSFHAHGGFSLWWIAATGDSHFTNKPGNQQASLTNSLGHGLTAPLPGSHLPSLRSNQYKENEEEVPPTEGFGSSFVHLISLVREFLNLLLLRLHPIHC